MACPHFPSYELTSMNGYYGNGLFFRNSTTSCVANTSWCTGPEVLVFVFSHFKKNKFPISDKSICSYGPETGHTNGNSASSPASGKAWCHNWAQFKPVLETTVS